MKNNTYKWIIGCLIGVIILLVSFLVVKENDVISVSFSECLSVAATLSSLILSIIAMLYTYYSGRDTATVSSQIQKMIDEVNKQTQQVSKETQKNSEMLTKIREGIYHIANGADTYSKALETIQQDTISDQDKQAVIHNIENTRNSMLMFLGKMQGNDE